MVTPWAANIDTKIVGSSHTIVAFFMKSFQTLQNPIGIVIKGGLWLWLHKPAIQDAFLFL